MVAECRTSPSNWCGIYKLALLITLSQGAPQATQVLYLWKGKKVKG